MPISVFVAFGYGLLSVLSPCVLPLLPVYLASLVGPEIFEDKSKRRRLPIFLHSLSFVIGFSLVFILWGAGSGLLGATLLNHLPVLRQVSGALLTIFGLLMLAALKIPWLNYERRLNLSLPASGGYLRSFLVGAVFPVAWIPCTSWVLGGILLLAGTSQTAGQGAYLLAIYSLGLGLPFLIMGAAFDFVSPLLKNIRRYSNWIYIISGLLLVVMGVLVLTDKLGWFPGQI
ncbi:MAG: sulfite exporter TauE/SafE family protein [Chloroflexi bacterium]|nr:sulfite exporter TauE/SafE family protein [Chloroflexota bacterium]